MEKGSEFLVPFALPILVRASCYVIRHNGSCLIVGDGDSNAY